MSEELLEDEKVQVLLRVESEWRTRMKELGEKCGLSRNQFIIEAMDRYGEVLSAAIVEEDREIEETRRRHRDRLRSRIHSSSR